jgi:predicted nucleic acid-binding protein
MHAVVDTNILVSGLLSPGRPPALVLAAIASRQIKPVVCSDVVAEYWRVLPRPGLRLPAGDVRKALALIDSFAVWVVVPPYNGTPALPDPADWPFIACALAAGCPVITGNLRHFPEGCGVRVMTARGWVDQSSGV